MTVIQSIVKLCSYANLIFRDQASPLPPTAPPLNDHPPVVAAGLDEPPNYNDIT